MPLAEERESQCAHLKEVPSSQMPPSAFLLPPIAGLNMHGHILDYLHLAAVQRNV